MLDNVVAGAGPGMLNWALDMHFAPTWLHPCLEHREAVMWSPTSHSLVAIRAFSFGLVRPVHTCCAPGVPHLHQGRRRNQAMAWEPSPNVLWGPGKMRMQTFCKVGKWAMKGLKQKAFPSKHLVADQPEQGSQWYVSDNVNSRGWYDLHRLQ